MDQLREMGRKSTTLEIALKYSPGPMLFKSTSFFKFHEHYVLFFPRNVIFTKKGKISKKKILIKKFLFEKNRLALGYIWCQ